MLLLGRKTALERVADFLLEMDARMRPSGAIGLPMLRRDIADYLGLTLETVSRVISRLEAEGVLELIAAREIRVVTDFWIDEMQNVVTGVKRLCLGRTMSLEYPVRNVQPTSRQPQRGPSELEAT